MGSNVAPPYANAYMALFEETFVYPNPLFQQHALVWQRYIDDIFCIWKGDTSTLDTLFQALNSIRTELQFTIHYDRDSISFLDTLVIRTNENGLTTDLYTKATDRNGLLHYKSCHPRHVKDALPKSQYTRIKRIVSDPQTRDKRVEQITHRFQQRGYPDTVLSKGNKQTNLTPRSYSNKKKPRLPFITTYHPIMPKIKNVVRQHWPILKRYYPTIPEFCSLPIMCTKRPLNLKDSLVRADIGSLKTKSRQSTIQTQKLGTFPCLHCTHCSSVIKGSHILHPHTGQQIPIRGHYTWDSSFVVYMLKCPCGLLYVGETTQRIEDRLASHKSTIRCKKTWLPVPYYFQETQHNISQLRYQIADHVPRPRRGGNHIKLLKQRESYWIHRLDTLAPKGLNRECDYLFP